MSDIASRVKAIIVDKLGVDENEVVAEASFTNDLGAGGSIKDQLSIDYCNENEVAMVFTKTRHFKN